MCEIKRGYAMLIQGGDPEISGALADPLRERLEQLGEGDLIRPASRATFPTGGRLLGDERPGRLLGDERTGRLLEGEGTNWSEVAKLVKVAVGNMKSAEDYAILRAAAEQEYRPPRTSELQRVRERLLAVYALTWMRLQTMFDWEGQKWREG